MLRISFERPALMVSAAGLALLAAGCATTEEPTYHSAAVAPYGAERLYQNDYVDDQRPSWGAMAQGSRLAMQMNRSTVTTVAFSGVDGARLAHELYGEAQAEKVDGNCGPIAKIENGETAFDIANYCDVPVDTLLAANPGIDNPRAVYTGQVLNVPNGYANVGNTQWANIPYSVYVVQPGDSIDKVAYSHRVSPTTLIAFNPGLDWKYLAAGSELRVPAFSAGVPVAAAAPSAPPAYAPAPTPSAGGSSGNYGYSVSPQVESLMPYKLTPAQQAAQSRVSAPPLLTVDRRSVDPGDEVTVSAVGLPPYSEVSIYRGPNGRQMELVRTVRTDGEGQFSEPVRVKRRSDPGGVIFKAQVGSQGYQSPRVGVNKIGDDSDLLGGESDDQ